MCAPGGPQKGVGFVGGRYILVKKTPKTMRGLTMMSLSLMLLLSFSELVRADDTEDVAVSEEDEGELNEFCRSILPDSILHAGRALFRLLLSLVFGGSPRT